ncbi:MAG TPA: DUF3318 domain-containing protein [Oscillatoriaceae cyanobacterium M33_DOE_052]|uniref:DUF3318 domain-containing protein n=1 Tax=Planktothricoides sp. SpSt-374 TaxID=2282167 RepID=A0A7C3VTW1_9CYAN|nr:DUF3318 domain-containing protein [Oscillatoriaceae cyanobacterium M33_DOE_052]
MDPAIEITRLLDVMPASGRMKTKLQSKPQQPKPIDCEVGLPWDKERIIWINFDLWRHLSQPQRDLLILRTVSWLLGVRWFKPDLYQGVVVAGILGTLVELAQGDAVGVVVAGGLVGVAGTQIWRSSRSAHIELLADTDALQVAQRRGYTEPEAARYLMEAIEAVAKIEGRTTLSFTELIRCQNLRAIAGISPLGIPKNVNL